jgi:peptidoglycan/LPS O-acetylase OafA/YrhL
MERRVEPRLPELDGLRGLAIGLVMLIHFTCLDGRTGWDYPFQVLGAFGWIGVDLFFVLSGFLITGVLLDTKKDPAALKSFYGRRALRILPVYYTLLLLYTVVLPAVFPSGIGILPEVWITNPLWYWAFLSNFLFVKLGQFPQEVMAVSWSLAIEEQFYLVWPLVVRHASEKTLEKICIAALAVVAVTRLYLISTGWDAVPLYVMPFTRIDPIAIGALVAIWRRSPEGVARLRKWRGQALVGGFGLLCVCLAAEDLIPWTDGNERWLMVVSFPALGCFFAALLAEVLEEGSRWRRPFAFRPLVLLGQWSFPIYLLNETFSYGARRLGFDPNQLASPLARIGGQLGFYLVLGGLCAAAGALLHFGLERPAQRLKSYLPKSPSRWRIPATQS